LCKQALTISGAKKDEFYERLAAFSIDIDAFDDGELEKRISKDQAETYLNLYTEIQNKH